MIVMGLIAMLRACISGLTFPITVARGLAPRQVGAAKAARYAEIIEGNEMTTTTTQPAARTTGMITT
jgi:hypothetical protein